MTAKLTMKMNVLRVFVFNIIRTLQYYSAFFESNKCFAAKPETVDRTNKLSTDTT